MKSLYLYLIIIFVFLSLTRSEGQTSQPAINDFNQLNKVLPAPPNAAALGKYGGLNVGLSTGSANFSIPLYNFNSGNIDIPLSLSYVTNGVKVEEIASRTGMTWTLNAGGVITRTIYGRPDDLSVRDVPPDIYNPTPELGTYINQISDPTFPTTDGQFDMFTFNFNGISGRFTMDTLNNQPTSKPVLLDYSDLKIVYNPGDGSAFLITTTDGTKYYFGGLTAMEQSRTVSSPCNIITNYNVGSFYLNKIIHPNKDTVNLTYTPISYSYQSSRSESIYAYDVRSDAHRPANDIFVPTPNNTNCITTVFTQGVLLQKIQSNSGSRVEFTYSTRGDINDKLLSSIKIYPSSTAPALKTFNLDYISRANSDSLTTRPFLKNITELSSDNVSQKKYTLSYNDISGLPSRLSYAQDHFGYYNGKGNSTLIPTSKQSLYTNVFPQATADRSIDPNFLTKGMLTSITYPTGGKDSVVYESNQIYALVTDPPTYATASVSGTSNTEIPPGTQVSSSPIVCTVPQQIILNASCSTSSSQGSPSFKLTTVTLLNLTSGTTVINHTVTNNSTWQTTYNMSVGSTYQLKIAVTGIATTGSASFNYQATAGGTHYATINSGGARIAKIITYDNAAGNTMVKKYSYNLFGTTQSSGSAMFNPEYEKLLQTYHQVSSSLSPSDILCDPVEVDFFSMHSNSLDNVYMYGSSPTVYANVEEILGENGENGKTAHVYTVVADGVPSKYYGQTMTGIPYTNYSYKNGKETYTEYSKINGAGYLPVKKVFTHFQEDSRMDHVVHNYIGSKNYVNRGTNPPSCQTPQAIAVQFAEGEYDLSGYQYFQKWVYADTVKTWTYDAAGQKYTEEKTITEYGNPLHALPTKVTLYTSDGATKTINSFYPPDLTLTGDPETGRQALVSGSMSPVLKQTVAKSSSALFTLNTDYSVFSNGLVLPKNKNVQVGSNPLETRIAFNNYDTKGNITDESINHGPHNSYQWGYNKQYPVAEAKNAPGNDIFYDSFEEGTGNSSIGDAKTGHYSFNAISAVYTKPLSGLDPGTYTLSYWKKVSGTWAFFINTAVPVTGSAYSLSISGLQIDDVRFYPSSAQMTTYTYDPLIGVTSSTDANGQITTYEYDSFLRLMNIKDKDGNVIKHIDYNYQH